MRSKRKDMCVYRVQRETWEGEKKEDRCRGVEEEKEQEEEVCLYTRK